MEFYVLDKTFASIMVIDTYISAIWTKRYFSCGDFEIQMPASLELIQNIQTGYYIRRTDDTTIMVVEKIGIVTDADSGNTVTLSGRSAESILDRRVNYARTQFENCAIPDIIRSMLESEFGENPDHPERQSKQIDTLVDNSKCNSRTDYCGFTLSLYDAVFALCETYGIGFRFNLSGGKFIPELYKGNDLSGSVSGGDVVSFSPEYGNLLNSSYENDISDYKTAALVYVTGEDISQTKTIFATRSSVASGLERREIAVDGSSVQKDAAIGETQYYGMLHLYGRQAVYNAGVAYAFTGDVDITTQFQYQKDWNIGDSVTIENAYGIRGNAYILAVSEKDDATGYSVTPTFSDWEV